jgi:hypothetical protein
MLLPMGRPVPKQWEFEDIKRSSGVARFRGRDVVRPSKTGLGLSAKTWERMGYPEWVNVRVSKDLRAIELTVPGSFHVSVNRPNRTFATGSRQITSVHLSRKLAPYRGQFYIHTSENVFVREEPGTIEP